MLRSLIALALFAASLEAALLPERFGPYTRGAVGKPSLSDQAIWNEYALEEIERAAYAGAQSFTITAFRFVDPTGAAAAFDWQRPPDASASNVASLAAVFPGGSLVVFGNYLLRIEGWQPRAADLVALAQSLPRVSRASLPIIRAYLPERGLIPNSTRYILGPASLRAFAPGLPEDAVAFQFSTEAQIARYRTPDGDIVLSALMYPSPQIARERVPAFEHVPGALVRRSGPIVSIVTPAQGAPALTDAQRQAAERVLGRIEYRPEFTWAESANPPKENVGEMILAIMSLAGLLILMALGFGLAFAGFRVAGKKFGIGPADDGLTTLNLGEK